MSLRVHFLGQPHFERDDTLIEFTATKAIALLAFLVVSHGPQPRDRILAMLWPDSAGDAARKNLRNTLWLIRRALGDDVVNGEGDRVTLAESAWNDVRELERLADNLDLIEAMPANWTMGIFLDGFSLADASDFEIWQTAER